MPMLPGETLAEFDARLKARFEHQPAPPAHIRDVPPEQRDAYAAALVRDADRRHVAAPPPVHAGIMFRDMTPLQRQQAAQAWGVAHVLDRSAYTTNPGE